MCQALFEALRMRLRTNQIKISAFEELKFCCQETNNQQKNQKNIRVGPDEKCHGET